ncbi:hypothetical protein BGZ94_000942 [Podila epigama]|nr:hypothetical protein BGZ94_000942 [Podila epigama]
MDYDDQAAQEWQVTTGHYDAASNPTTESDCDDYWFIPTYARLDKLKYEIERIETESGTHLRYNSPQERIDMWGPHEAILIAKSLLDRFSQHHFDMEQARKKTTRSKGWAKPERELTPAEKKKAERREKILQEQERYLGMPQILPPYRHCFICPKDVPIFRLLGNELQNLDSIRAEFKTYMWIDRESMRIWAAGESEPKVHTAISRIKNFCMKWLSKPEESSYHVLDKPSQPVQLHMVVEAPALFLQSQWAPANKNETVFLKAIPLKGADNLLDIDLNLGMNSLGLGESSEGQGRSGSSSSNAVDKQVAVERIVKALKYMENMHTQNMEKVRKYLQTSLDQIHRTDYDMKMRIRLGQVELHEYPKNRNWDLESLDKNIIPNSRLHSMFNRYVAQSADSLEKFMSALGPMQYSHRPESESVQWTLSILKRGDTPRTFTHGELDVSFREDGKLALWNALVERTTPLEIKVICPERKYSWAWDLTAARRLPLDKFSPEGVFVHLLRLEKRAGQENRFVFSNTNDIQLRQVHRKKKTLYTKDSWVIEVVEESFWVLPRAYDASQGITLSAEPHEVMYSVSMYRASWPSRFSENPFLGLGQVPSWKPKDFISGEEATDRTFEFVKRIQELLEKM